MIAGIVSIKGASEKNRLYLREKAARINSSTANWMIKRWTAYYHADDGVFAWFIEPVWSKWNLWTVGVGAYLVSALFDKHWVGLGIFIVFFALGGLLTDFIVSHLMKHAFEAKDIQTVERIAFRDYHERIYLGWDKTKY